MDAVLHICEYAAAYKGNFICSLLRLEAFLKEKNMKQVYLFPSRVKKTDAAKWIDELKAQGCAVYVMHESFFENLKLFKKIKAEHNIKRVFRHFASSSADVLTWLVFGGKNTVHFFHSMYSAPVNSPKHILRKIILRKNLLIGVSETVSKALERLFPKNKVITLNNAICFDRLDSPGSFNRRERISCLAMGYNIRLKGADLALDAVSEINKKRKVDLYIVAASHLRELEEITEQKFGSQPEWLQILPPDENIATYFNGVDILLAPSRSEGLPYATVEAAYCKTATVFSDIPQHMSLCIDKRYCFKKEDVSDFVLKLEQAIDELNSPNSLRIRQEVKERVQWEYNIALWCEKVFKLI